MTGTDTDTDTDTNDTEEVSPTRRGALVAAGGALGGAAVAAVADTDASDPAGGLDTDEIHAAAVTGPIVDQGETIERLLNHQIATVDESVDPPGGTLVFRYDPEVTVGGGSYD